MVISLRILNCFIPYMKEDTIESKDLALYSAQTADAKKSENILVLDVREISSVTSYFVLCSGKIDRHVRAIADEVEMKLKEKGMRCFHREGDTDSRWIVLDYFDVIIHIFDEPTREYYRLETLWGDAEALDWNGGPPRL